MEGSIFFAVLAKCITTYLLANHYINTSCQKAGVPGFPGCMEHTAMIWEQIQAAKRNRSDLHIDLHILANAYRWFPHQVITFTLDFFHLSSRIQSLVGDYFKNFHVCYTTQEATTSWHSLQKGTAMGCSISPILFTAVFEIILIGSRQMVRGVKAQSGQRLPVLQSYMDDLTTLLPVFQYKKGPGTTALSSRLAERSSLIWWSIPVEAVRTLHYLAETPSHYLWNHLDWATNRRRWGSCSNWENHPIQSYETPKSRSEQDVGGLQCKQWGRPSAGWSTKKLWVSHNQAELVSAGG